MSKLEKAMDLYLRGFNGQYIKSRTGISIQSLLKQLKAKGVHYVKQDIIEYQVAYIQERYSTEDVKAAYKAMSSKHEDLYAAQKHKQVICLGCCFGSYQKVMMALLGQDVYKHLRNQCWSEKQKRTVQSKYGVDNVFCKSSFGTFVTKESVANGRKKRNETMLERYGVSEPNQNVEIKTRMQETWKQSMREKYGVENIMQCPEVAKVANEKRQKTMTERYGAGNSVQIPDVKAKIFESRRNHGTLTSSIVEDALYELLTERFGVENVIRNVIVDKRYPYHVDFYIPSRDMFIELNGDKSHGNHWFDVTDMRDVHTLESLQENSIRLEAKSGKSSRYRNYIKIWTETDVLKRRCATMHRLNYLVFWDGSTKKKNKHTIACLSDAREWLDAGCPDSWDWNPANTY